MRLLLDEHFSPQIARQLRARGHDVIAVQEQPDLIGRPDRVHFASMPEQRRAIVTRDLADFRPLLAEAMRKGTETYGVVCVSRRFRSNRAGIGALVRALDELLDANREDGAVTQLGGEVWLQLGPATPPIASPPPSGSARGG